MKKFRVAISDDFMTPDGQLAFPSVDLSPLDNDPRIDWKFVHVENGRVPAESVDGIDALILLAAKFDSASFPGDGRLALIARFGVGYDNVDVEACNSNDVALAIAPSGVRRPVAVAIMTFVLALSGNLLIKDRLTRGGPEGLGTARRLYGSRDSRFDTGIDRRWQYRGGARPPGAAFRHEIHRSRPLCRSERCLRHWR